MKLTTLLICGGLVCVAAHFANIRIVDRVLPGRVSLQSVDTPPPIAPASEDSEAIAGRILNTRVIPGKTPADGAMLLTDQPAIYRAPFPGIITPINGGIRYQSPQLSGAIDFTSAATLSAPGHISAGMALSMGASVMVTRRDPSGQAIALDRPLLESLQVGVRS